MNNKVFTVTVGIPAFNEENNITSLLAQVLNQEEINWKLKEIIVSSDGSTDNTINNVKKVKNEKIVIFDNKIRKGKSHRINQIFKLAIGEIIVLLDADVKLKNKESISSLLNEFINERSLTLVGGNPRPFKPKTFFESAVYSTFYVLDQSRKFVRSGSNIYCCSSQCLAIRREFAKTISLPEKVIADDDFIYFSCIARNLTFRYCDKAVVYYQLPKNVKDYFKQVFRSDPDAASRNVKQYFGQIVHDEYNRPLKLYAQAVIKAFFKNPPGVSLMIIIRLTSKLLGPFISKNYKLDWYTARSTK